MTGPLTDTYTIIILLAKWTTFRNYRGRRNLFVMVFVLLTFIQYRSYIYIIHLPETFFFQSHTYYRQPIQLEYLFENICMHFRIICHLIVSCNTIPSLITSKHTRLTVTRWFVLEGVRCTLNCTLSSVKKKRWGVDLDDVDLPKISRIVYYLYVTINITVHTHTYTPATHTMNISHVSHTIWHFWFTIPIMIMFVLCYNIKSKIRISLQSRNGTTDYNMYKIINIISIVPENDAS